MHGAFVVHEAVPHDEIVRRVLHVDRAALQPVRHPAIAGEVVLRDQRARRVTTPDAADGVFDEPVPDKLIPFRERHLNAVRRRVGEIILDQQIPVAAQIAHRRGELRGELDEVVHLFLSSFLAQTVALAAHPFLADGVVAGEAEEAIAAVCRGVLGDDIVVALFEGEDASGVLTTVVDTLDVSTDAEVEGVSRDAISAAPPERESPAGEERAVVVVNRRVVDPVEDDPVLATTDA